MTATSLRWMRYYAYDPVKQLRVQIRKSTDETSLKKAKVVRADYEAKGKKPQFRQNFGKPKIEIVHSEFNRSSQHRPEVYSRAYQIPRSFEVVGSSVMLRH